MALAPNSRFGGYLVLDKLGAGGMGVVWRAVDTRLDREVALKVLPDSATADPLRLERLVREAKAASALNHPNIVTIYEINSDGDQHFIAMELIHGRALSDILRPSLPFPPGETVRYMIQFCDGLAKAHAARIVHRDIKPSNIMLTDDGLVKILDFGLAKSVPEPSSLETTHTSAVALTVAGVVMGTIPYMAPEQAAGEPAGARSDVFSTGVVLYEMLAGVRPFDGRSRAAVLEAVLRADPAPLQSLAPAVPDELADIVHTCLRKAPEARYANAGELAIHLRSFERHSSSVQFRHSTVVAVEPPRRRRVRQPVAVGLVVLALVAAGYGISRLRTADAPAPAVASSAETLRNAQGYLQRYDRKENIDRAIQQLAPAVAREPSNAALRAALAEAFLLKYLNLSDRTWLQQASASAREAVNANDDLAAAHVALGKTLVENGQAEQATAELQRALALDPLSSPATVALARVYLAQQRKQEAGELFMKAVQLAPDDWFPMTWLSVFYYRDARYGDAIETLRKAQTLSADNVVILKNLGPAYYASDRYAEAAAAWQRALELDPTMFSTWANLGTARYFQGQYATAATALRKAVDLAPNNYLYWGNLGDAYRWAEGFRNQAGDAYAHAIRLAQDKLALNSKDTDVRSSLAVYLAKSGNMPAALTEIAQVERTPSNTPETLFKTAIVHELAHDREKALKALGGALRVGFARGYVENEPELADLRSDPRFAGLTSPKRQ